MGCLGKFGEQRLCRGAASSRAASSQAERTSGAYEHHPLVDDSDGVAANLTCILGWAQDVQSWRFAVAFVGDRRGGGALASCWCQQYQSDVQATRLPVLQYHIHPSFGISTPAHDGEGVDAARGGEGLGEAFADGLDMSEEQHQAVARP